jgi:transcriptional regulator with XRE-family HTH domain
LTILKNSKGSELREIRQRLGWTQVRMAAAIGLDPTYVSQLETGRQVLDDSYLAKARDIEAIEKSKRLKVGEEPPELMGVRLKCHTYLGRVLDACQGDRDREVWTYVELQRHFPLPAQTAGAGGEVMTFGAGPQGPSSAKASAEEAEAIRAAEAVVDRELQEQRSLPRAGAPSGGKSEPSGGSGPGSKGRRPFPPGQAPK